MSATVYVSRGRRRRRNVMVVLALSLVGVTSWKAADALAPTAAAGNASGSGWGAVSWPSQGAAAAAIGTGRVHTASSTQPMPIASLAKVMTAVVVLRSHPVSAQDPDFTISITPDDVEDTARRRDALSSSEPQPHGIDMAHDRREAGCGRRRQAAAEALSEHHADGPFCNIEHCDEEARLHT